MAIYGYARVSTEDQDLTIQQEALKSAGCEIIRSEKVSGTSTQGRDELNTLLEFLRDGDELGGNSRGSPCSFRFGSSNHR